MRIVLILVFLVMSGCASKLVKNKHAVVPDMSMNDVIAAVGEPTQKTKLTPTAEMWFYEERLHKCEVVFKDGKTRDYMQCVFNQALADADRAARIRAVSSFGQSRNEVTCVSERNYQNQIETKCQ